MRRIHKISRSPTESCKHSSILRKNAVIIRHKFSSYLYRVISAKYKHTLEFTNFTINKFQNKSNWKLLTNRTNNHKYVEKIQKYENKIKMLANLHFEITPTPIIREKPTIEKSNPTLTTYRKIEARDAVVGFQSSPKLAERCRAFSKF